jgi:carbon storage regulator
MLILTRKLGERIIIGGDILITLVDIKGSQVRIGIDAPSHLGVYRQEIFEKIKSENVRSSEVIAPDLAEAAFLLSSKGPRGNEP